MPIKPTYEQLLKSEQTLKYIVDQTSFKSGYEYLIELVSSLHKTLKADYVFIATPVNRDSAKTIVLCTNEGIADNFNYELKHTPCEKVFGHEICCYPTHVCQTFPKDYLLQEMGIEGYIGVPLYTQDNQNIGIMVCLYSYPIEDTEFEKTILQIFGNRAATEIERLSVIQELKATNEQLEEAKKIAEENDNLKTQFLQNLSHEIRTPLNGIIGFSEFLQSPILKEQKRIKYAQIIKDSGLQLIDIINDIIEISKLETRQVSIDKEDFCLKAVFDEIYDEYKEKASLNGSTLCIDHPSDSFIIYNDKEKLENILKHITENAVKFTANGTISLKYNIHNDIISINVEDTGLGISPENHETVFKRFMQEDESISNKYGGLGLGLAIAKENIELLGGTIELKSEKHNGATFDISLPLYPIKTES